MDDTDVAAEDAPLTPLHPNHVKAMRLTTILWTLPFVLGAGVLEQAGLLPPGLILFPVLAIAAFLVIRTPLRRYHAKGYALGDDRLRVVRGLLFRSDTIVPFVRVQHIDVDQGPIERFYDIATLTLHTAGTHGSSVHLPGLAHEDALAMRETIRRHIGREET